MSHLAWHHETVRMGVRPEIIHLPWDRPIVATAVDWLVAGAGGDRVDLSETWVLLPTRQAGRQAGGAGDD